MKSFSIVILNLALALSAGAQEAAPFREPDARYKADILLVVAHPDDEGAATAYLARAIDEGKRVAVVYGTRGSSGGNEVGTEQAPSLGAIREIEARRANATLGITNVWFLGGKDTASQDVLVSLANWDHGAALEQLVRLMRLTRPEVVLTFLPGTFVGEDHGDHQAAGVLATEAFDLAGDPTVFPSQVAEPLKRLEPYLEGLRPWQPKKIFYFPDAEREDIFRDKGPSYSVKEISKSSKKTVLARFARRVSSPPDTSEKFCRPPRQNGRRRNRENDAGRRLGRRQHNERTHPIPPRGVFRGRRRLCRIGSVDGPCRFLAFLRGVSCRPRADAPATPRAARNRAAGRHLAGHPTLGEKSHRF